MIKTDSNLSHLIVSRGLLDWAAGVTASVATYQASDLLHTNVGNRVVLAICFGLTIMFVMRKFRVDARLKASLDRLSLPLSDALDSMSEGILVVDRDHHILLANRTLFKSIGSSVEELINRPVDSLPWTNDEKIAQDELPWSVVLNGGSCDTGTVLGLTKKGGAVRKFLINASTIPTAEAGQDVALVTLSDVTDLESRKGELVGMLKELENSRDEVRRQNSELHELAIRDPLTGCINRRGFFDTFESLWSSNERTSSELACLMVDIDHFKSINDTHGHQKGDDVLVGVADVLRRTFRDSDLICRYGGEEFCVVLPEQTIDAAIKAGERFRASLENTDFDGLSVTASIGVSSRAFAITCYETMIDQADQSLYIAKRSGRNQLMSWEDVKDMPDLKEVETSSHRRTDEAEAEAVHQERRQQPERTSSSGNESTAIPTQAVSALVSALAFRDPVTAEHSTRVASLCVSVGQSLMADRELRVLETAALLHDIGKIGVPDSILLKPGQLDEQEWEVMRRQERMGVEIVRSAFASDHLARILKTHNAYFGEEDSQPGMPSGNNIPVAARIISVCNAFDSMTTDRVYRKGMTYDEAFAELRKCAGQQFDPAIVETLIDYVTKTSNQIQAKQTSRRYQSALQLGKQIEQIADAMQEFDIDGLEAISIRLAETANYLGADAIAEAANRLAKSIAESHNIEEIVRLTQTLLTQYHESQADVMMTTSAE